ncbi:MAG: Flp family type IVb pilin, partial [Erythrobacter sp.]
MMSGRFLNRICSDQSGATAVEYGLILSLICIAALGAMQDVAEV